jgi:hypothetical protein
VEDVKKKIKDLSPGGREKFYLLEKVKFSKFFSNLWLNVNMSKCSTYHTNLSVQ